ncbi:MAG: hypothetical protein PHS44_06850 [Candidatus Dojkabacteria bacterium]|nr:hypothetical protein [Candidatus Dojkabacteria bacterium]
MKHILKQKLVIITVSVLLSILLAPVLVSAATSEPVSGTAGVVNTGGEIDFDNYNSNAVVDPETGAVSGYVWSEDLGWIDFLNNGEADSVEVDLDNGSVSGLAYALNTGGHVDFTNYNSNVVWDSESGTLSGYGWSEDLGWIDFAGALLTLPETGQDIRGVLVVGVVTVFSGLCLILMKERNRVAGLSRIFLFD